MQGHDTLSDRAVNKVNNRLRLAACLGCTVLLLAGCKEHRISLAEFVALQEGQEGMVVEGIPATQPGETITSALAPEEEALINRELGPYRVGAGDVLGITVIGPDTSMAPSVAEPTVAGGRLFRVDRKGEIRIPQVGAVKVAGLEFEDIEALLLDLLIKRQVYTDPDQISVNVSLAAPYMTDVLVQGAATTPGIIRLRRGERNLMFAIAAAGGVTQLASGKVVLKRLRRPGEEVRVNLFDPQELKTAVTMAPLESGDILEVESATPNTIFVGGLVFQPGPQVYPPGTRLTVLQALAAASGVRDDMTPREGTLIRHMNGKDVHVKLDLDRIQKAKDPNIQLAAGDVLWVPHTAETRVQDWINKNVFFRMGASATANYGLDYSMPGVDYLNRAASDAANINNNNLQDTFDPFGFLLRNQSLQTLQGR